MGCCRYGENKIFQRCCEHVHIERWAAVVYKVRGDWVWIRRPAHKWATKPVPIEALRPHPTMVGERRWDKVGGETAADVVNVYNAAEAIKVAEDRQKPQAWRELDFDD